MIGRLTPSRVRVCVITARTFYKLYKNSGKPGLVRYLKSCQVILMQSIGSHHLRDMTPLGCRIARTKGGLPRIIPRLDREKIRKTDVFVIRFWMSVFSLYRLIEIPSIVKLETITTPPKPFNHNQFTDSIKGFILAFDCKLDLHDPHLFPIYSTSGTQLLEKSKPSVSFRGIVNSVFAIFGNPVLFDAFEKLVPIGMFNTLITMFNLYASDKRFKGPFIEGALAFLPEPAGKMRVIAMVDCFTQFALRPLHDAIFKFLTTLETDGTFEQFKPVQRLLDKGHHRF